MARDNSQPLAHSESSPLSQSLGATGQTPLQSAKPPRHSDFFDTENEDMHPTARNIQEAETWATFADGDKQL